MIIPDGYVDDSGDWTCEARNEAGQATQNVRVTIKGRNRSDRNDEKSMDLMEIEKKGKAKRMRKPAPKAAPKQQEEPPKAAAPEPPAPEPAKAPEICKLSPSSTSNPFCYDLLF